MNKMLSYLFENFMEYQNSILIHLKLSFSALIIGVLIGIIFGILCLKYKEISQIIINFFNFLRIIPSLVVLILILPLLGTGFNPALVALVILGIPPILINTYLGITSISPSILEAGKSMGMNNWHILLKIQGPLATPLILTGIRIAAVEIIASATLASYIGAGGLGDIIFTGLALNDHYMLFWGGISVAALSICSEIILFFIQHYVTKYERY